MNRKYGKAAVEVLDILNHVNDSMLERIPSSLFNLLNEIKSTDYTPQLQYSEKIYDMELLPETEVILGYIYMNYWTDEQGRDSFEQKLINNEKVYNDQFKIGFDAKNIFGEKMIYEPEATDDEEVKKSLIVKKETFIARVINRLKGILGGNRYGR